MKRVFCLLLLFFVSGCTRLELALKWADTYVMSSVNDFFDLTSDQKNVARNEFNRGLDMVRKNEFPLLAKALGDFANAVEKNEADPVVIEKFLTHTEHIFRTALQRFEPMAQKVTEAQSQTGFKSFDEEFRSRLEEDRSKFGNEKGRLKRARKKLDKIVDETFESLTDEQTAWVEEAFKSHPEPVGLMLEGREAVFKKFQTARLEEAARVAFIKTFFMDWESLQPEAFLKARKVYQDESRRLIVRIFTSANPKQRKNLIENFRSRAEELSQLAQK